MASSGNFCTLNRLVGAASNGRVNSGTMSLGNLKYEDSHSTGDAFVANMAMTGKTYCEVRIDSIGNYGGVIGLRGTGAYSQVYDSITFQTNYSSGLLYHYKGDSDQSASGNIGGTVSAGNIVMFAYDPATYKWWVGVNGTWRNSGDPANGSGEVFTGSATMFETMDITWGGWVGDVNGLDTTWNWGQDSTFGGVETAGGNADDNGFGDFKYSPPTGFLALCTGNMSVSDNIDPAQTDDNYPSKQFGAYTYTANNSSAVTVSTDFQPDLIWIKNRSATDNHYLQDSSRGFGNSKSLSSNQTGSEGYNGGAPSSSGAQSVGSSSFQVYGSDWSKNTDNFIAWCWKCNGGTTTSDSSGDITVTRQTNDAAKFSILTYTGSGSSGNTIAHGLGVKPAMTIIKQRNSSNGWNVWHQGYNDGDYDSFGELNSSGSWNANQGSNGPFSAAPGTDYLTLTAYGQVNGSSNTYVAYVWADVEGMQKFGFFEGNSNANGPFVYTGFRPRLVFCKAADAGENWQVRDTARSTFNADSQVRIYWNSNGAEGSASTASPIDFLSTGFKVRGSNSEINGNTVVYGAWGDVPAKYPNTF